MSATKPSEGRDDDGEGAPGSVETGDAAAKRVEPGVAPEPPTRGPLDPGGWDGLSSDAELSWRESGTLLLHESVKRRLLDVAAAAADHRRARLEQELRWTEERIALALEAGHLLLWSIEPSTGVMRLSKNAGALLGFPRDEPPRMVQMEHVHPDDRAWVQAGLGRSAAEGVSLQAVFRWIRPVDGVMMWLEAKNHAERDAEGNVVGLLGTVADVTERKRGEELRAHAAELERTNHRIEAASRAKNELIAHMSHELRTPLNAIIGFTEMLHDGLVEPGTPEHKEFLATVLTSARHLLSLVETTLEKTERSLGEDSIDETPDPSE